MFCNVLFDGTASEDILFEDKDISTCNISWWSREFV